jgi:hypothetical protein
LFRCLVLGFAQSVSAAGAVSSSVGPNYRWNH